MTDERRPLTDSQIEAGLARRAPRGAGSDLLVSIVTVAERTGQVSTWWPPQRPSAMTPRARLAWVAILVALSLAIGGLIVAAGSARHGPELGLTLEPTLTPSLAAVVPPSIAPTKSPRPSPTASPTEVSNIPPSTTQASSCEPDPIRVVPASAAPARTASSITLASAHTLHGAYVTLAVGPPPDYPSRGGDLWALDGGTVSRRVATIEGQGTVYPVVADESLDGSTVLISLAQGDADGNTKCVEMFEVRTGDGVATRLVSQRVTSENSVGGPGRSPSLAGYAQRVRATYASSGHVVAYSTGLRPADTVGYLLDGVDRSFRIRSTWAGPFPSPGPRDVILAGDTAVRSLACYGPNAGPAAWSPYGDRIAVPCDDGIGVVDPLAGSGRSVRVSQSVVGWDRFGDLLSAWDDGATLEIQSVDVYGGTFDVTTLRVEHHDPQSGSQFTPLEFSPDGDGLLEEVWGPDGQGTLTTTGTGETVRVPRPGIADETRLATIAQADSGLLVDPTWSIDSRSVLYVTPASAAPRYLDIVDVSTGTTTRFGTVPANYGNGVWRMP